MRASWIKLPLSWTIMIVSLQHSLSFAQPEFYQQKEKKKMVQTRTDCLKRVKTQTMDDIQGAESAFINILSRVDAKSAFNFKSVSSYWHATISNKYFTTLHLNQSRENPSFIVCPSMDITMKLFSMKLGSFELVNLNAINPVGRSRENYMYMISSFNGLICCVNSMGDEDLEDKFNDLQIWMCNPCSGETLLLPQGRPSFEFEPSVGVAYGSDISDYKVFRIFCDRKKISEERIDEGENYQEGQILTKYRFAMVYECEVYSSCTGSWENIGPVPCVPMNFSLSPYKCRHVFVGEKIYWLVSLDDKGKILSADLEGRFEVLELPEYLDDLSDEDKITEATYLINLRGSLSVIVLHTEDMDIWVWKEDGEQSSWVLECHDFIPFDDNDLVLTMTSLKNQILCVTETHWCSYDVDTRIWDWRRADSGRFVNPAVFAFTESVLPCNGGVRL